MSSCTFWPLPSVLLGFSAAPRSYRYRPSPPLNWDVSVSSSQIYKSLIEYEKWSMGGWGEAWGEINDMDLHVQTELPPCVCIYVCLHVCIGGAAALLDIWMSNDVVPDWAITTSARLLKRGWSDGGRRLVALVPRKWQREQCRKFYIYSISLIESIHTQSYVLALRTSRHKALFTSPAVACVSLKSLKRCGWLFAVV